LIVLTADYAPGNWSGIGVAVAYQAAALAELGCDVDVITPHPAAARPQDLGGPRLHLLRRDRFPFRPAAGRVVHLHSLSLAGLALELKRRFRARLAYTAHSLVHRELPEWPVAERWARVQAAVFAAADHLFFLTQAGREEAADRTTGLWRRSSVLPNGVPVPPAATGRSPGGPVAFVGRFARSKGIDLFVETARLLIGRGCPANFVLAGGHGDPESVFLVDRLVADHPDRCRATGWLDRPALNRLYAAAAVVLVPSRYEPFGLVALEAMRAGAPVLGAAVGGLSEVLASGSGGLRVTSASPDDWADACERVLCDPELCEALRRQGPAHVRDHYDVRALARRLLAAIGSPRPAVRST
jgi:1,4-alpha-glucan branching enzyme